MLCMPLPAFLHPPIQYPRGHFPPLCDSQPIRLGCLSDTRQRLLPQHIVGLHSAAAGLPLQLLAHPLLPLRRGGNIRFVRGH